MRIVKILILVLCSILCSIVSFGQITKKIGYAISSDVTEFPEIHLGDYIVRNIGHISNNSSFYSATNVASTLASITTSSGNALFTSASHPLSNGDKVGVNKSKNYRGYYTVSNKTTNTFTLTKLDGSILQWIENESNVNYYVISAGHDNKNFSIGAGSHGKACYDQYLISSNVADLSTSKAYVNHYSNGQLKNTGTGSGGYAGPVGNRIWLIFDDITAPVTNSGGNALVTIASHGIDTRYIMLKITGGSYASRLIDNYWYVESASTNTFKLRSSATGAYMAYVANENITFNVTISASAMNGADIVGTSWSDPVIVTNLNGRFVGRKAWESVQNYGFSLFGGSKYLRFTGHYDPVLKTGNINYQGREANPKFHSSTYGVQIEFGNTVTSNAILNWGDESNFIEVDHIEVNGRTNGFAGNMAKTDAAPYLGIMYLRIHDSYIHDTGGEGFYIGNSADNTPGSPQEQHGIHLTMYNITAARTGAEILQAGHLVDGSRIFNCSFWLASTERHAPFYIGQSSEIQYKCRTGQVTIDRCIFVGGAFTCMSIASDRADETAIPTKYLSITNSLFFDGLGQLLYYNMANDSNTPLELNNIWVKRVIAYDTDRNESQNTTGAIITQNDLNTKLLLNNIKVNSDMDALEFMKDGNISSMNNVSISRGQSVPEISYVKSGFDNMDVRNLFTWFRNYNAGHPTHPSAQIAMTTSDYVLYNGKTYKVLNNHNANLAPDVDVTNYGVIYWDANGTRSDEVGYTTAYSINSPDDYRQTADSFYNLQGIGLLDNVDNTTTRISYQWCHDNSGSPNTTFIQLIKPFKNKDKVNLSEAQNYIGTGKWIRKKVEVVRSGGIVESPVYNSWYQII